MTEEQKQMVMKNQRLTRYLVCKYAPWVMGTSNMDDYMQMAALGMCKAAMSYKPEMGTFATYAGHCVINELRQHERRRIAPCRDYRRNAYSLDQMVPGQEGTVTFGELLASNDDVETQVFANLLQGAVERLDGRDSALVQMLAQGKTQTEIGCALGLSQGYVSRLIRRIQLQIRREVGV